MWSCCSWPGCHWQVWNCIQALTNFVEGNSSRLIPALGLYMTSLYILPSHTIQYFTLQQKSKAHTLNHTTRDTTAQLWPMTFTILLFPTDRFSQFIDFIHSPSLVWDYVWKYKGLAKVHVHCILHKYCSIANRLKPQNTSTSTGIQIHSTMYMFCLPVCWMSSIQVHYQCFDLCIFLTPLHRQVNKPGWKKGRLQLLTKCTQHYQKLGKI